MVLMQRSSTVDDEAAWAGFVLGDGVASTLDRSNLVYPG